ncbi:InlB B-repeat-containing protein [Listeria cossartiae subsp. cayugensis]|uniref:InlB B-repeat-containing protein n=1 Tax=Listeria cossartiae subsp. cayugensis TaxID=2713505 RepID=A0ABU2IMN9_9LIST|nr:InlB B-repeat-containing protein [Listeria cossartiae]MDT0049448.1 InlB B-repeat-containing protein [Listeria cossartiae subsp. cayugensis]MDT0065951.1 InlB B-repeat-containing protein [Listeria cossartiae subsp. cayugensis]MDT0078445.1 InlB B-repeat-containing protein [Listeria cossartiae subsp. cayugensis]MDT0081281.1 InlB B-repeat-containing protein [Listeria cossartiae subsp. cayugensis]MDT0088184.1 InlB B-repeat-containing protein [Listeria cossartiae subsp. cayugensis]
MEKQSNSIFKIVLMVTAVLGISLYITTSQGVEVRAESITQPTPINEIFPDPVIANDVKTLVGKSNVTDTVLQSDLDGVTRLAAVSAGVTTIDGIQYLNNLSELELKDNQITDLSPLENLKNLTELSLSGNPLKDVSLIAGIKSIKTLDLVSTQITDITPLTGLSNLQVLYLDLNQITDISPIAGLSNLQYLSIEYTQVSDLTPVANLSKLTTLNASDSKISDISPLASLPNLVEAHLKDNQISDVSPLANIPNLFNVTLTNQTITSDPVLYQTNLVVPNAVKGPSGAPIAPATISNNGIYASPNLTWNLASFTNNVSYTFNQPVTFKNATVPFSGTVTQPLTEAFTAVFDVDGKQTSVTVGADELIKEPTAPTKTGYTFTGWYDAKTGGNKWDFATDKMPAEDITLYAQFTINSYNATFDIDGTTTTQKVAYQALLNEPTAPTKAGYTFKGWYDAKTGGTKWDFATGKMPAENITLYAQFTKNDDPNTNPTGNDNGTTNPNSSGDNTSLPTTGDENTMIPIFAGAVLIGIGLVAFRKKRQTK